MHILRRELPTVPEELPEREAELRVELAAAHLEALEARTRLIDTERTLERYRFRVEAAEKTIPTLTQQSRRWEQEVRRLEQHLAQLQVEMNALLSSRWWRLGNKLRAALRRIARPLPSWVKAVLRAILRKVKRALPS